MKLGDHVCAISNSASKNQKYLYVYLIQQLLIMNI